jgi:hypothetical protein
MNSFFIFIRNNFLILLFWLVLFLIIFEYIHIPPDSLLFNIVFVCFVLSIFIGYFLSIPKLLLGKPINHDKPILFYMLYFILHLFFLIISLLLFIIASAGITFCIYCINIGINKNIMYIGFLVIYFCMLLLFLRVFRNHKIMCNLIWYGNYGASFSTYITRMIMESGEL